MANILYDSRVDLRLDTIEDYKEDIQSYRNSIFYTRERIISDLAKAEDVKDIMNVLSCGLRDVEEKQMYIDYSQRKIIDAYSKIMDVVGEY